MRASMRAAAMDLVLPALAAVALSCHTKATHEGDTLARGGAGTFETCVASMGDSGVQPEPGRTHRACSQRQLVTIAVGNEMALVWPALEALSSRPDELGRNEVEALLAWMRGGAEQSGRRSATAQLLARNVEYGVVALREEMQSAKDPLERVYCAGALARGDSAASSEISKSATLVLLQALANPDDSHREAGNLMPRAEPWMVEWVLPRITKPDAPESLVHVGFRLIASLPKGPLSPRIHETLVAGLRHQSVLGRIGAVEGLRGLGFDESDAAVYGEIARDKDPTVRSLLYAGLVDSKAGWTTALLVAGLSDPEQENRAACARGLGELGSTESLGELVAVVRSVKANEPFGDDARSAGEAVVKIAGLKEVDFARRIEGRSFPGTPEALVVVDRQAEYRQAAAALLGWWDHTGRRQFERAKRTARSVAVSPRRRATGARQIVARTDVMSTLVGTTKMQ
jgi:hypothetical protein